MGISDACRESESKNQKAGILSRVTVGRTYRSEHEVTFTSVRVYPTYTREEYDRSSFTSTWKRCLEDKKYKSNIGKELNEYKALEMDIHPDSTHK